ncbi:MAG: DUF192 domain-containing protein [Xanthobacteraceae bacterium]|jgi:uncharacterized membrane protein (UPF0127 family)
MESVVHWIAPFWQSTARRVAALVLTIACALLVSLGTAQASGHDTIKITSHSGIHAFSVELATDDAERARGLMFRKVLPQGHGMLFDFKTDQPATFWMHNTYISLDIIFIEGDGRIRSIAKNAQPMSDAMIPSGGPVRAVLEVIAGTAQKLGIAPGDTVTGSIFGRSH